MTQAATTAAPAPQSMIEVPASEELRKLLSRANGESNDLKRLLTADIVLSKLSPQQLAAKSRIEQAILVVEGMEYLRGLLTDEILIRCFKPLMGNPRGFLTDRDRKPEKDQYEPGTVRECLIEAMLLGVSPLGNQFNIISGRTYITRNGITALLQQLEGLTDLRVDPIDVPEGSKLGSIVPMRATWCFTGKQDSMERRIPVRVNEGQGADAILGKADRKMKAAIYARLTGTVFTEEGEIDDEAKPAKPNPFDEINKLNKVQTASKPAQQADGAQGSTAGEGDTTSAAQPSPAVAPGTGEQGGPAPRQKFNFREG